MKLAIASPSASAYSETFIRQVQMEQLPCRLRIHGGPVASETVPGGPIAPLRSLRGIVDTIIEVGLRGTRWEGPQRRELQRRLRRAGIQVLLANYGPTGVALLPVCEALNIPLVVHFHGFDAHLAEVIAQNKDSTACWALRPAQSSRSRLSWPGHSKRMESPRLKFIWSVTVVTLAVFRRKPSFPTRRYSLPWAGLWIKRPRIYGARVQEGSRQGSECTVDSGWRWGADGSSKMFPEVWGLIQASNFQECSSLSKLPNICGEQQPLCSTRLDNR